MLIGQFQGKLGEKRRVAIPAKFRTELGESPILARWYENCLVLVSQNRWQALLKRVRGKKGLVTAPVRDLERFILGSAYELEGDDQGRVIIPEKLAEYAQLGENVVFLGLGDRVEVWNEVLWKEKERVVAQRADEELERIAKEESS